jgi:cell fate regulator YaaT (PSP1 superfamily)
MTRPSKRPPSIPWGTDEDGPVKVVSPLDPVGADDASADASPSSWTGSAPAGAAPRAGEVVTVVGVRVTVAGRVQPCDTGGLHLVPGDRVIVDGERGPRLGTVATAATRTQPRERLRRISRRATDDDLAADAGTRDADRRALRLAKDRAAALRLPIKVFRVEHSGGTPVGGGAGSGDRPDRGGRMIVHYTSDDRLELGGLARDLTMATDARVELRAIGARDEAKVIGGIGTCGLELCCSTWLPEFVPISIKMAKDQGLVLNPTKVAGQCGRLKCCLVYEQATYAEMRKGLPKLGKRVITPQGEGRVVEVDVLRQRVRVSYGMGESEVLAATEVQPMFPAGGGGGGQPARRDERGPRRDDRRGPPGGTPHDDRPPTAAALAAETHDDDDEADDDDLAVGGEDAAPPAPEPEPEPDDPADDFPDPDDDLPS